MTTIELCEAILAVLAAGYAHHETLARLNALAEEATR